MPVHTLERSQIVTAPLAVVWEFFSSPRNLERITPKALDFHILSELPPRMYAGMMIRYRVRPLLGIPMIWVTEITHIEGVQVAPDNCPVFNPGFDVTPGELISYIITEKGVFKPPYSFR